MIEATHKMYTGTGDKAEEVDIAKLTKDFFVDQPPQTISALEAMNLNRHERRRLAKVNGIKIPGIQDKTPSQIYKDKMHFRTNKSDSIFNI